MYTVKKIALFLIVLLIIPHTFTSCTNDYITINVYNVGDYIDEELIEQFEAENPGIKVNYETYYTNEEMHVRVSNGVSDYDVIFPSDYMLEKMIEEDLLREINYDNIPNFKEIGEEYLNQPYDPEQKYSVPYMWGTMGILYNTTMVDEEVDSWQILWNEKYKDNIFMLDSERDTLGITLKMLGYSMNTKNENELNQAKDMLIKQKPLVLAYVGDEVKDKMINEEAALSVVWSGDAYYCMSENENLDYAIPKEGTNLWFDCMAIPKTSKHPEAAEKFINFLCRPDVALQNTEYIEYSSPIPSVVEELGKEVNSDEKRYPDITEQNDFFEVFKYDRDLSIKQADIWQIVKVSR